MLRDNPGWALPLRACRIEVKMFLKLWLMELEVMNVNFFIFEVAGRSDMIRLKI